MKNFLFTLVALFVLCFTAPAQTTTIYLHQMDSTIYPCSVVVPPGKTTCKVTITSEWADYWAQENTNTGFGVPISATLERHVTSRVAWNYLDFTTPSPYAPFIESGVDFNSTRSYTLSAYDGTTDWTGASGSNTYCAPDTDTFWSSASTFEVSLLQGNYVYVKFEGRRKATVLPSGVVYTYASGVGAVVEVTFP